MLRKFIGLSCVLVVAALGLAGCGSSRSVEAFCSTYWDERNAYVERTAAATDSLQGEADPFAGLLGSAALIASSIGDTVIIFDKLSDVAPEDIEPDVSAIRDSLKAQVENAGAMAANPLAGLAGGLFQSLATGGSWNRVSNYIESNCGTNG